jgi:hypothetical protein
MGGEPQAGNARHASGIAPLPDRAPIQDDHRLGSLLREIPQPTQGGSNRRSGYGVVGGHNLREVANELLLPGLDHRRVQPLLRGMVSLTLHGHSADALGPGDGAHRSPAECGADPPFRSGRSEYASGEYVARLEQSGVRISMASVGNP